MTSAEFLDCRSKQRHDILRAEEPLVVGQVTKLLAAIAGSVEKMFAAWTWPFLSAWTNCAPLSGRKLPKVTP